MCLYMSRYFIRQLKSFHERRYLATKNILTPRYEHGVYFDMLQLLKCFPVVSIYPHHSMYFYDLYIDILTKISHLGICNWKVKKIKVEQYENIFCDNSQDYLLFTAKLLEIGIIESTSQNIPKIISNNEKVMKQVFYSPLLWRFIFLWKFRLQCIFTKKYLKIELSEQ